MESTGMYRTPLFKLLEPRGLKVLLVMLLRSEGRHVQHMQKALTQMNVQLANVLSDILGESSQNILRAIAAGERDGQVLSARIAAKAPVARTTPTMRRPLAKLPAGRRCISCPSRAHRAANPVRVAAAHRTQVR
jgi:hypothetical protein